MALNKAVGIFFIVVSCFPWVGIPSFDTQPFPFLIAIIYISIEFLAQKTYLLVPRFILLSSALISAGLLISLSLENSFDFLAIRGSIMYLGIPIYIFAFTFFIKKYGFPLSTFYYCNIVWIAAALLQLILPDLFLTVVSSRTTGDRGLTSLAPEPTFFGIYLFFSSWILAARDGYRPSKKSKIFIILNIISIMVLAMSSMAIIFVFLAGITMYACNPTRVPRRYMITLLIIFISTFAFLNSALESSRLYSILTIIFTNPELLFTTDASSNSRLSSIIIPIHSFFKDYLIPHGFYAYPSVSEEIAANYGDFFFYEYSKDKIDSWLGSILFELGIFGFIGIIVIFHGLRGCSKKPIIESLFLFVILLSAIPVAFPLVYLLISILRLGANTNANIKLTQSRCGMLN